MKSAFFFFSTWNNCILSAVLKLKRVRVTIILKTLNGKFLTPEKEHMVKRFLASLLQNVTGFRPEPTVIPHYHSEFCTLAGPGNFFYLFSLSHSQNNDFQYERYYFT